MGSVMDKLRVALLRTKLISVPLETVLHPSEPSVPLDRHLQNIGFSIPFINAFFRPFYQGIFLAPLKDQCSHMFNFVFRMFAEGAASLPKNGIGAVSQQMLTSLPKSVEVKLNSAVSSVSAGQVVAHGVIYEAPVVIVATEGPEAVRLLGGKFSTNSSRGSICLYFSSNKAAPLSRGMLVLNGNGNEEGPVNNMFVPSQIAPSYAPPGKTLISTTIVGDELGQSDSDLEISVRKHMAGWFGQQEVDEWKLIRIYRIRHSQSAQGPDYIFDRGVSVGDGIFVCGDHRNSPTLHGAILSGETGAKEAMMHIESLKI